MAADLGKDLEKLAKNMLFVAALVYFENDGTAGSEMIISNSNPPNLKLRLRI
jgi:hypothetical protein